MFFNVSAASQKYIFLCDINQEVQSIHRQLTKQNEAMIDADLNLQIFPETHRCDFSGEYKFVFCFLTLTGILTPF
jgi:hypothetical protein